MSHHSHDRSSRKAVETMDEAKNTRAPWGTRHGEMLDHVFPLWYGPRGLEAAAIDGERFYGWSVLSLAVRFAYPILLESRIAYAHLFDEEQQTAILRAVSWDDRVAQRAIRAHGQQAPLQVPARFVRVPLDQLRSWLTAFKDLTITADQVLVEETSIPIRRLRVEWEYTSCVIEKVWKGDATAHATLLAAWTGVWEQMGAALRTAPQLAAQEIEELFYATQPDTSVYTAQEYRPDWLSLG